MRRLMYTPYTGYFIGTLPAGCRYCLLGAKIVIFVTGLCIDRCWYCPISRDRLGRDVIYADEIVVKSLDDILIEAYRIRSMGAGITGGDPIMVLDRTCNIIKALKREFGDKYHIHLYTTGSLITKSTIECLESAGLDEIRFHIYDMRLLKKLEYALDSSMDVGVELPLIPNDKYLDYLKKLIKTLDDMGVKFINLNQFEVSETNINEVIMRGLKPIGITVAGANEYAMKILEWAAKNTKNISIHYCPIEYKDQVQYRRRMLRKAIVTMGVHEVVLDEGTLVSIELLDHVKGSYVLRILDKMFIFPTESHRLKDRGVRAIIREYFPDHAKVLNERTITY